MHGAYSDRLEKNAFFFSFNRLSNDKICWLWPVREFYGRQIHSVANMIISVYVRIENIVGKGNKFWFPAFSPFFTVFSKAVYVRVVKTLDCVVKSKALYFVDSENPPLPG